MKYIYYTLLIFLFTLNCESSPKKNSQNKKNTEKDLNEVKSNSNKILLLSDDQMKFDQNILLVKVGQKITLTLKHVGKLDKTIMGHNFVLLKKDVSVSNFAQLANESANNDYIPNNSNDIIAHTKMIGGGESDTINFDAPEKGVYTYICSFPGHFALMRGKLIVD